MLWTRYKNDLNCASWWIMIDSAWKLTVSKKDRLGSSCLNWKASQENNNNNDHISDLALKGTRKNLLNSNWVRHSSIWHLIDSFPRSEPAIRTPCDWIHTTFYIQTKMIFWVRQQSSWQWNLVLDLWHDQPTPTDANGGKPRVKLPIYPNAIHLCVHILYYVWKIESSFFFDMWDWRG